MKRWEYRTLHCGYSSYARQYQDGDVASQLNTLGRDGWEVVAAHVEFCDVLSVLMKRELPEVEEKA